MSRSLDAVFDSRMACISLVEHSSSAVFSTVVCPPKFETNTVHGISDDELRETFAIAFDRMVRFLNNLANTALLEESDSDDEIRRPPMRDHPQIVIVACSIFEDGTPQGVYASNDLG